jgi:hypothetical protein
MIVESAATYGRGLRNFIDPMAIIREIAECYRVETQEETKREMIRAKKDVELKALNDEKKIILAYFEARFAERKQTLEVFFNLLHQASEENHKEKLHIALTGILGVINENPLQDMAEFRKAWSNRDFTFNL